MADPMEDRRRSRATDRDQQVYERRRRQQARRRAAMERDSFDATPPSEDDWVVGDRTGLRRFPSAPTPLADVLEGVIGQEGWRDRLRAEDVLGRWSEVVGEDVAARSRPVRLAGGVLVVAVDDHAWATQLRYLTEQLRMNVNRALGEPVVDRIDIQIRTSD